jgi:hypothetical protein
MINRLMMAIALITSLSVIQSCSVPLKTEQQLATETKHQDHHSSSGADHDAQAMSETEHESMNTSTNATLRAPKTISVNQSVPLTIDIQDSRGKAIASFEAFQEKLMHLIVVSNDLEVFQHLHPVYQGSGRFTVEANFPRSGPYTLFTDYQPTARNEQVSVLQVAVPGAAPDPEIISFDHAKTIGNTQAILELSQPTLTTGQEVMVTFNLKDATTNQAVTDLQPYLGEAGHLVILRQSSSLTRADYIHAHALQNTPEGQVSFVTQFSKPGHYKLWGQFDRGGEIIVADFWVKVQ